jgi:hypothetical protein
VKRARNRLTYANVVSTLALFSALSGGAAFAVSQLAPKSVGARQLRPGAVTADKIRKNAVTAPKLQALSVKNGKLAGGSVTAAKLASAAVTGEKVAAGAIGTDKLATDAVTGAKVDESSLGQVPSAARADFATAAESANPAAFAAVDQEGNVDVSLSKGIGPGDVTQGKEAGIYCVSVPGFSPRGAQVTLRYNGSGGVTAFVTIGGTGSCPAPEVEVQIHNGGLVKAPFYIALYR